MHLGLAFAQTAKATPHDDPLQNESYYIDRSGEKPRFVQRLMWEKADYVLRYVAVVERLEPNGRYVEIERINVFEANFVEVSLNAGQYRYRIDVYDLLDNFAFSTEWQNIVILRATQPKLTDFIPEFFYIDEQFTGNIILHGENILPESEFFLVGKGVTIKPQSHRIENQSVHLTFSKESLIKGKYEIYVRNPGGLDYHMGTFSVDYGRANDWQIAFGYAPIFPLQGFLFKDTAKEAPFPDTLHPFGSMVKIGFVPFKYAFGYLGFEFAGSFTFLQSDKRREIYTTQASLFNSHVSVLYQKYLFKRNLALNINIGAGFTTLMDFQYVYPGGLTSQSQQALYPSATAGLFLLGFFTKPFYISAGVDYIQVFSVEQPMVSFLRPSFLIGIRLWGADTFTVGKNW